jgi:hypothetical protein
VVPGDFHLKRKAFEGLMEKYEPVGMKNLFEMLKNRKLLVKPSLFSEGYERFYQSYCVLLIHFVTRYRNMNKLFKFQLSFVLSLDNKHSKSNQNVKLWEIFLVNFGENVILLHECIRMDGPFEKQNDVIQVLAPYLCFANKTKFQRFYYYQQRM